MNQDKERAEFEEMARAVGHTDLNLKQHDGSYLNFYLQCAYEGWQASAARYTARIAELEAEVAQLKADSDRTSESMVETIKQLGEALAVSYGAIEFDSTPLSQSLQNKMHKAFESYEIAIAKYEAMKGGA